MYFVLYNLLKTNKVLACSSGWPWTWDPPRCEEHRQTPPQPAKYILIKIRYCWAGNLICLSRHPSLPTQDCYYDLRSRAASWLTQRNREQASRWILQCVGHSTTFSSFKSMCSYLAYVFTLQNAERKEERKERKEEGRGREGRVNGMVDFLQDISTSFFSKSKRHKGQNNKYKQAVLDQAQLWVNNSEGIFLRHLNIV